MNAAKWLPFFHPSIEDANSLIERWGDLLGICFDIERLGTSKELRAMRENAITALCDTRFCEESFRNVDVDRLGELFAGWHCAGEADPWPRYRNAIYSLLDLCRELCGNPTAIEGREQDLEKLDIELHRVHSYSRIWRKRKSDGTLDTLYRQLMFNELLDPPCYDPFLWLYELETYFGFTADNMASPITICKALEPHLEKWGVLEAGSHQPLAKWIAVSEIKTLFKPLRGPQLSLTSIRRWIKAAELLPHPSESPTQYNWADVRRVMEQKRCVLDVEKATKLNLVPNQSAPS